MVAVTVRNVPDSVRDELAARAARAGQSLQEFLVGQLTELAARPSAADVLARSRARLAVTGSAVTPDDIVAAVRQERV